jgi:hypothetical protein
VNGWLRGLTSALMTEKSEAIDKVFQP